MNREQFERFFEYMCDQLSQQQQFEELGFTGALGAENPGGVKMVFLFRCLVLELEMKPDFFQKASGLQEDESLDMIRAVDEHEGSLSELLLA